MLFLVNEKNMINKNKNNKEKQIRNKVKIINIWLKKIEKI